MSKYGCGISMKTAIKNDFNEIMEVLEKYGVTGEDLKIVTENYKHLAFECCNTNAIACAVDNQITEKIGCAEYMKCVNVTDDKFKIDIHEKMKETYPWWSQIVDDDEEEE